VKLDNILLQNDGTLRLADFGLAQLYSPGEKFTVACGTLGT
jgi:serine/threonine protein kinase